MDTLNSVLLLAGGPGRLCCRTIRGRRGFCSCLFRLDQALGTAMRGLFNDKITGRVTGDDVHDDGKGDMSENEPVSVLLSFRDFSMTNAC